MSDHEERVRSGPIGVVLAGGLGRRLGGNKAVAELAGRPLIWYPVHAMRAALGDVAVIAKPDTALPSLPGVTIWIEAPAPRHPLAGITEALRFAAGRPVFVCAADLPLLSPALIAQIAATDPAGAPVVVAARDGTIEPLLGVYWPVAGELLGGAPADRPARELVAALGPRLVEVGDPQQLFNVNTPEELRRAGAMLASRT